MNSERYGESEMNGERYGETNGESFDERERRRVRKKAKEDKRGR